MENEKRLIDAEKVYEMGHRTPFHIGIADLCDLKELLADVPTVDAVVLPCKIGDDVYIIPSKVNFDLNNLARHKENNRVYHQKVANIVFTEDGWYMTGSADLEWGTGKILLDKFYQETWFLTSKEAEAALAKMDGGNEDGKTD